MPKIPTDYSKTIIYGIFQNDNGRCVYVGHTTNFIDRKRCHKLSCVNESLKNYHLKLYKHIRENGGWENFSMRLIEEYPCSTKQEATQREFYNFQKFEPSYNTNIPGRTQKGWYNDNIEHCRKHAQNYYIENIHHLKEKCKVWREANKEEQAEYKKKYREENAERIRLQKKAYHEENKEMISEKKKKKYEQNKEKINEMRREKYKKKKEEKNITNI